jgi:hypothetical protein
MRALIAALVLLAAGTAALLKEVFLSRPALSQPDACISCHGKVSDPDPSHPVHAFGCARCHLGNPHSLDKSRAHHGLVRNPGDLRVVEQTCASQGCHPDLGSRVKKGLMATNRGILETVQGYFPSRPSMNRGMPALRVADLLSDNPPSSLGLDQYRKMCGGCHLWKKRKDMEGEAGLRGGGCSDCHVVEGHTYSADNFSTFQHSRISTRIPSDNCIKCHNRSARIGLSYFGLWESDGYGTPYKGAELNPRRLSGGRFHLSLSADVHFSKAAMQCVDCHTGTGLMGDGKEYASMEEQVDISCEACHIPVFTTVEESEGSARRLFRLNRQVPDPLGARIPVTRKGTPLYNVQGREGRLILYRKSDGVPLQIELDSADKPHHRIAGHERLSCQSCHSAWIPQCYGCHIEYKEDERQTDWLTGMPSLGRWREARSYMRFEKPALGLRGTGRVYPVSPCQVFFREESFRLLTLSAFDPHTTSEASRDCRDCHGEPKTLGLGEGILRISEGGWIFRPTQVAKGFGLEAGMDGFVTVDGKALHGNNRTGTRPFEGEELRKILEVNACVGCHMSYGDPIYADFALSKRRFITDEDLPCLR